MNASISVRVRRPQRSMYTPFDQLFLRLSRLGDAFVPA